MRRQRGTQRRNSTPAQSSAAPVARTLERQIADIMTQVAPRRVDEALDRRVVTVLVTRIGGYAALCEEAPPHEIGRLLDLYHEAVRDSAGTFLGTVHGSIGDLVVATWNAVWPQAEHALLAVNAALEMVERMADVQLRLEGSVSDVSCAVGINTGDALVRSLAGSRHEVEAVGDAVNVAQLLSWRAGHGEVLIGQGTEVSLGREIDCEPCGEALLPGKRKPVLVYRVTGRREATQAEEGDVD